MAKKEVWVGTDIKDLVLDLWGEGATAVSIGYKLQLNTNTVYSIVERARKNQDPRAALRIPSFHTGKSLKAEAHRRGLALLSLKRLILTRVVEDNLFTAILDD